MLLSYIFVWRKVQKMWYFRETQGYENEIFSVLLTTFCKMKILFFIQLEKIIFLFCYLLFFSLYNFTVWSTIVSFIICLIAIPPSLYSSNNHCKFPNSFSWYRKYYNPLEGLLKDTWNLLMHHFSTRHALLCHQYFLYQLIQEDNNYCEPYCW